MSVSINLMVSKENDFGSPVGIKFKRASIGHLERSIDRSGCSNKEVSWSDMCSKAYVCLF